MSKIIVIGDLHAPFHNKKALKQVLQTIKKERPDYVIQIGDLYDSYFASRFTKKNLGLPQTEWKQGRKVASEMWAEIRRSSPRTKCIQVLGNHCMRAFKRIEERLPELQEILKEPLMDAFRFPGVKTIEDTREELIIDDIVFIHGYRSRLGDHMKFNLMSTVCGHSHKGGVVYEKVRGEILFEANAGFLADENQEPLRYSMQRRTKWTLGYLIINNRVPTFVPLKG